MNTPKTDSEIIMGLEKFNHYQIIKQTISRLQNLIADKKADEWQDIDSAPKDGREILVYIGGLSEYFACDLLVCMWKDGSWFSTVDRTIYNPTKWKPITLPKKCSE